MAPLSGRYEQGMEQVAQGAKKAVKQQTTAIAHATKSQVVPQKTDVGTAEGGTAGAQQTGSVSDQAVEAVVKTAQQQSQKTGSGQKQPSPFFQRQIAKGNTSEEAANLEKIRNELHKQYFEQLTKRQKPEEAISIQVELEKQEEDTLKIKEQKKKREEEEKKTALRRKQRRAEVLQTGG